jgi:hypothetical protein
MSIDWKKVPKAALIDTMRSLNLGPSNLTRQDKADLVEIAKRYMRADAGRAANFKALLADAVPAHRGHAAAPTTTVQ